MSPCIFSPTHCATASSVPPHCRGFTLTLRHAAFSMTPLYELPAQRRGLYLATHNIHKIQISVPPVGFEPAIPASEQPHTHAF